MRNRDSGNWCYLPKYIDCEISVVVGHHRSLLGLLEQISQLFKQQTFISGGWKSEIRVPAQLDSGEVLLWGCRLLTSCCVLTQGKGSERALGGGSLCKSTHPVHEGSTHVV